LQGTKYFLRRTKFVQQNLLSVPECGPRSTQNSHKETAIAQNQYSVTLTDASLSEAINAVLMVEHVFEMPFLRQAHSAPLTKMGASRKCSVAGPARA
jgi:hypothetical protein